MIEDNRLEDNSVGAFLMYSRNLHVRRNIFAGNRGPSGYGLGLKDMQGVIAEDNVFAGNRVSAYLDNPPVIRGRSSRRPARDGGTKEDKIILISTLDSASAVSMGRMRLFPRSRRFPCFGDFRRLDPVSRLPGAGADDNLDIDILLSEINP